MKSLFKLLLWIFGIFWGLYILVELFVVVPQFGFRGVSVIRIFIGLVLFIGPIYYARKKL